MSGFRNGRARSALALGVAALALSCVDMGAQTPGAVRSGDDEGPSAPADVPPTRPTCEDGDGDGFGQGCAPGPDCDDRNPQSTRECRACLRPATGCPCDDSAPPVACNLETGTTENGPEGVCRLGQRVCRSGAWSACESFADDGNRYVGAVSPCNGTCDPSCRHIVDCYEPSDPPPPGCTNVIVSTLPPSPFCATGTASGGLQPACEPRPGGPYVRSVSTAAWVDACAAAGSTTVLASTDDAVAAVALPFSFAFWGVPYRSVNVSSNGLIQFGSSSAVWANTTLPAPSAPNALFAFWDDLMLRAGGVCVATVGTAPSRRTVLQWNDAGFYPTPDAATHLSFEVILSESGQTIDLLYQTMQSADDRASGSSATVGLQENSGTRFDLVAYNSAGVTTAGAKVRWTPQANDQYCPAAVWRRTFQASCPRSTIATVPTWGRLNYTSRVPSGASIRMEARVAATAQGLTGAAPVRLPDAPRTNGVTPVASSFDLGDILQGAMLGYAHMPFVELTAYLDPGPDANLAPALGSVEVQFNCMPAEAPFQCDVGSDCFTSGVCRRGTIACPRPLTPVCVDAGPAPAGTSCGTGQVCNAVGACVPCNEGAACDTGNACEFGRVSCTTGAPVCVRAGFRSSGTACGFGTGDYTRGTSPLGFIDACSLPGADVWLGAQADGAATVTLPFPFRFYGTTYTQAGVSVNGALGFPTAPTAWTNTALPATGVPDSIFPFWDDLQTRPAGLCVATLGRAPERLLVAQWANVDLQDRGTVGDLGASLNFETVLEESTQAVHVLYGDMVGDDRARGSGATIGIQRGDRTRYDQVSYNSASAARPNSSIRWTPPTTSVCDGTGTCSPCLAMELCDGRDNNCNALVDEGLADLSCGVGACRRTVPACVRGVSQTCTPGTPTAEICNGIDDDCDGVVDDSCTGTIACPADVTMYAGDTRSLSVTTMGMLRNFTWTIVSAPTGGASSVRWSPTPATATTESFQPIIVGVYRLRVSAVDGLNATRSCEFNVTANARGLRVELTWNGNGDVDLHMLDNSTASRWFSSSDCYYNNMRPSYGAWLDVDNVTSDGPENVRIDSPPIGGSYTIGIHNYARGAGRVATVRVYCGTTAGVTPTAVYASLPLSGSSSGNCTSNTFWRVVRVVMRSDGGCDLTPLNTYTTSNTACSGL